MLYEYPAKSRDTTTVKTPSTEGQVMSRPADAIKDPVVLEFLGLEKQAHWRTKGISGRRSLIDFNHLYLGSKPDKPDTLRGSSPTYVCTDPAP